MLETRISSGPGHGEQASRDVDGDAADLLAGRLHLARVQAGADPQPEPVDGRHGGGRAAHPVGRGLEGREEAVARGVDLPAAVPLQLAPDGLVVPAHQGAPPTVAQLGRHVRGPHDVGEQHRPQLPGRPGAGRHPPVTGTPGRP